MSNIHCHVIIPMTLLQSFGIFEKECLILSKSLKNKKNKVFSWTINGMSSELLYKMFFILL